MLYVPSYIERMLIFGRMQLLAWPEPPPESLTEEELTLKNVAKACADLAAMLLRDEAGPPGPPTYDDMD